MLLRIVPLPKLPFCFYQYMINLNKPISLIKNYKDYLVAFEIERLQFSKSFDRKAILEPLKETFAADNFKIDEASLSYKLIDDQLYIQGLAVENEEKREVGFRFGM